MPAKRATKNVGSVAKKTPLKTSKPAPKAKSGADAKLLLELYREMMLIRRFEERAGQLYGMGLIGGFCHLYIGQEAVVTGMMSVGKTGDSIVASYRCHGHMLACGMDPKGVMAELTGRADGYSKGKGGSMHMFSKEKNFYGGHGIVGAQVPIATGLGFAHKHKKDGFVAICYLGDGAVNQGQVYESLNMAALWKLPVLYIIENNKYGMGTSQERASAGELHNRGEGYGIPGLACDGMDILAVREAGAKALDYVRGGRGPMILEMMTYRYRGHSMSDPAKYRTREEVDEMRKGHDPIDHLGAKIIESGAATEAELKEIDREIRARITEAADFATSTPEPAAAELWTDILVDA
jgi:pyruvate dehydrogenase E1 component alpha subunit